jgi:hypothetical protein
MPGSLRRLIAKGHGATGRSITSLQRSNTGRPKVLPSSTANALELICCARADGCVNKVGNGTKPHKIAVGLHDNHSFKAVFNTGSFVTNKIEAHEQNIARIFSDSYEFEIPPYQRPYAWETEQARELLMIYSMPWTTRPPRAVCTSSEASYWSSSRPLLNPSDRWPAEANHFDHTAACAARSDD